jgi:hypothetical protein
MLRPMLNLADNGLSLRRLSNGKINSILNKNIMRNENE